ncbi:hypothetical protein OC845_002696 [Tilletia horrida]|nr:hypothetical protein OC845_002696 [Tilletia horrida]
MAGAPSSPAAPSSSQQPPPASGDSLSEHEHILLRSAIRRILEAADLSSISAKNVREELITLQQQQASATNGNHPAGTILVPPTLDIMSHKKQVNALVKQLFEEVSAQKEQEAEAAAALAAVSRASPAWNMQAQQQSSASRSTFAAAGGIALPGMGSAPPAPPPSTSAHRPSAAASTSVPQVKKRKREDVLPSRQSSTLPSSPAGSSSQNGAPNGYRDDDIVAELEELDDDTGTVLSSKARKLSKNHKAKRAPNPNNPFNKPLVLSAAMAEVCGSSEVSAFCTDASIRFFATAEAEILAMRTQLSRPQVVKQLWAYIKGNELQNPQNKRQILCDSKLKNLFGKSMVE